MCQTQEAGYRTGSPAVAGASEDARKSIMGHVDIGTTAGYTHWSAKALADITGKTALTVEQAG